MSNTTTDPETGTIDSKQRQDGRDLIKVGKRVNESIVKCLPNVFFVPGWRVFHSAAILGRGAP